jgi:hypothetical protein
MCISFGEVEACPFNMNCDGSVYEDTSAAGPIYRSGGRSLYAYTSDFADQTIRTAFQGMINQPGRYFVLGHNCRDFSQDLFIQLLQAFGNAERPETSPPPVQPPAPKPGYGR